jgi:uncharacterized protein YeaO (DUF488 family)
VRLSTFRYGTPRRRGEGLRILTTRRPPRGVKKADWTRAGDFDVWLPSLGPSLTLLSKALRLDMSDEKTRARFFVAYEREMAKTEPRQTIALLAALAGGTPISIGCFCEDESRCHRSRLRRLIENAE